MSRVSVTLMEQPHRPWCALTRADKNECVEPQDMIDAVIAAGNEVGCVQMRGRWLIFRARAKAVSAAGHRHRGMGAARPAVERGDPTERMMTRNPRDGNARTSG